MEVIPIATDILTVPLDKGLDTVTPPILREDGTLVECLNYEIGDTMGYRRIAGFEPYDGWADGGLSVYYFVAANPVAGIPAQLVPGAVVYAPAAAAGPWATRRLGILINATLISGSTYFMSIALQNKQDAMVVNDIIGIGAPGQTWVATQNATASDVFHKAFGLPVLDYYNNVRVTATMLRGLVTKSATRVAGIHYSRDRLYKVIDLPWILIGNGTSITLGARYRLNGIVYRAMHRLGRNPPSLQDELYLLPIGTDATVNNTLIQIQPNGTTVGGGLGTYTINTSPSYYGYMVTCSVPTSSAPRGDIALTPTWTARYTAGTRASGIPPLNTFVGWTDSGGTPVGTIRIKAIVQEQGSFTAGTAEGHLEFEVLSGSTTRDYPIAGDKLDNGSGAIMVLGTRSIAELAGTQALWSSDCRYQFGTYNFYAKHSLRQLYGTNGVFRAFWADTGSYGNIIGNPDASQDNPKYLSFHCGSQLALGYAQGTVQLSAVGEPYNFNGVDGASETGTGDKVTGLLEASGTSTIIVGSRSIRRLSGVALSLQLETINPNIGGFDYTAESAGGKFIFTNQNGITTLDQSAAYGDFSGGTITGSVSTRLVPQLVDDVASFEIGGVVCATICRAKSQYRLYLNNGDMVSLALTADGPKPMYSNYSASMTPALATIRVPLAWSSEVGDDGAEYIHHVWDEKAALKGPNGASGTPVDPYMVYRMDWGWGFAGKTFEHYFDVSTIFAGKGWQSCSIEEVRMHGMGYGIATLDVKSSGLEDDYLQDYHTTIQDISMPYNIDYPYNELTPITGIVDQKNWGLGIKLRINGTNGAATDLTEPVHLCQVLQLHANGQGAIDS